MVPVVAQMSGSQYMGGGAAGSSSGGIQSLAFAPLVDCPHYKVKLVRIRSKQQATFGQTFVKCPNNIKVSQIFLFNFVLLDGGHEGMVSSVAG